MDFNQPTFNLIANIFRNGNPPPAAPDRVTICNLCRGERNSNLVANIKGGGSDQGGMWLLCPKGTDIQDSKNGVGGDFVEVPAGSGRIYNVVWVDDAGCGFRNEHRFAGLVGLAPWPTPFPTGDGAGGPPPAQLVANSVNLASTGFSSIPFTCGAGKVSLGVYSTGLVTLIPVCSLSGSIPPDFSSAQSGDTVGGSAVALYNAHFTVPGGTYYVRVDFVSAADCLVLAVFFPRTLYDVNGTGRGVATPTVWTTIAATSSTGESGIAFLGSIAPAGNTTWTFPWIAELPVDLTAVDAQGNTINLNAGIMLSTVAAVQTASVGQAIGAGYVSYGYLEYFK